MKPITVCPSCGSENLRRVRRKWSGQHKGEPYTIDRLEYYECPDCGEEVYDREAMRIIEENSPAFARPSRTQ